MENEEFEAPKRRGRPRLNPIDPNEIVDVSLDLTADYQSGVRVVEASTVAPDPDRDPQGYAAYVSELRQKRKTFGSQMQKLAYPPRSGYKRHWFNDIGGRIQEYLDGGWSKVIDGRTGKPVSRTVGSGRDNAPLKAFLLELPTPLWEEVETARNVVAQERMDGIKKSPIRSEPGQAKAADKDKFYSPREEIIGVRESFSRS